MNSSGESRKIYILASTLVTGGAEIIVKALALGLGSRQFDTEILCLGEPGEIGAELEEKGVPFISNLSRGRLDPTPYFRLRNRFRKGNGGVLFALDHHNAVFWGAVASRAGGLESRVLSLHSTGLWGKKRSLNITDRLVLDSYEKVVALSSKHADYLVDNEGVRSERIEVINNGVDVEEFSPVGSVDEKINLRRGLSIPEDSVVVAIVAALRPEKNHLMFLDAASRLMEKRKNMYFLIVGDGPEMDKLSRESVNRKMEGHISFLGVRTDVAEILKCVDISVLCSYPVVETFPVTVLEAMASGLPVVSTDVGSVSEIIREGNDGFLIKPGDVDALEARVADLADEPGLRSSMGSNGRKRVVDNFSKRIMLDKYRGLFKSLI